MILENFQINSDLVSIDFADRHLDLHNCFQFLELVTLDTVVEIKFRKTIGDWVNEDELPLFGLKFKMYRQFIIDKQIENIH